MEKASQFHDRRGIDYWVILKSGVRISIDVKVREIDFAAKDGKDDLALESWSVVENRKPGWTWDGSKKTDYILWLWVDTGRWCLLPFQLLRRVTQKNIFGSQGWRKRFPTKVQQTSGGETYHSECVFVPRRLILKAIEDCFGGAPASMIFQNGAERGS